MITEITRENLSAECYDLFNDGRGDTAFFVEMVIREDKSVLELGCSTGRILVPMVLSGSDVVGFDSSFERSRVCRQNLQKIESPHETNGYVFCADMRAFHLSKKFNVALFPFRSFQHLMTSDDRSHCLKSVCEHLTPDGLLVIDNYNPSLERLTDERYLEEFGRSEARLLPDGRCVTQAHRSVHRDLVNQALLNEEIIYVAHPNGRTERVVFEYETSYLYCDELIRVVEESGFRVIEIYGDYEKRAFDSSSSRELICVARKK